MPLQVSRGHLGKSAFEGSELGVLGCQAHMRVSAAVNGVNVSGPLPSRSLSCSSHTVLATVTTTTTQAHAYCACAFQQDTVAQKKHFNPKIITSSSDELRVNQTAAPAAAGGCDGHLRGEYLSR